MKKYLDINFNLHKTFAFIGMLFFSAGVFAQSISGNVSSEDGPLPGATIVVKGTENGTSTDFDGNFTINASDGDVLIVSFIGFDTQEVAVSGDQVDVVLAEGNDQFLPQPHQPLVLRGVVIRHAGGSRRREMAGGATLTLTR